MSSGVEKAGQALPNGWSRASEPSAKFFQLAHLRSLRKAEQVAAVCFRVNGQGIEFLLVQTRGGRWTFPKGSTEPGLTHAQAAALEAFEEAGVHGRMEEASFARYSRRKRGGQRNSASKEQGISAHLCEVSHLEAPQESGRHPTWFSAAEAKRRLREGRTPDYGSEMARVVDRAAARIQQLRGGTSPASPKDALQKVHFIDGSRATTIEAQALSWRLR